MAGIDPVSAGLSVLQTGFGLVQSITGAAKVNALEKQRTAYKTPEEIGKILQLSLSQAGGDTQTRDYQNTQLDNSFAGITNTAQRLGADPNNLSALWEQMIQGKIKVGQDFHASNLESMSKVYGALNLVADNKAAEWKSQEDILKDRIQAASGQVQAGYQNMSGGFSTGLAAVQASKASNLFTTPKTTPVTK